MSWVRLHAPSVMMSWHNVVEWCHMEHWWCHPMMKSWHYGLSHDIMGLAYKRHCAVLHRVHFGSTCLTVHFGTHACLDWCADVPTFLEPTSLNCIWVVVVTVSVHNASTPLNTSEASCKHCSMVSTCCLHRTIQLLVGAHEHCSWSRRFTPSETYSCQDDILSPAHSTHHIYMTNNTHECRYWTQAYSVDGHIIFGEKTLYYLQRDFTDMIYDLHVER